MGIVNRVFDPTGSKSDMEINAENLSQLIDEMNRTSDQLDAITNSLNIINKNSRTASWDGSIGGGFTVSVPHGFGSAPIFVAYFNRSDQPNNWYPFPQWFYDNSGNTLSRAYAYTDSTNINLTFFSYVADGVVNFTVSYYILQQPAQLPPTK